METITPHWDNLSLLVYCILGILGAWCIYKAKHKKCVRISVVNRYYIALALIWGSAAVYRYVGSFVGGADTSSYIRFFNECLDANSQYWYIDHMDILYRVINQMVRFVTSDYHVVFWIIYLIIIGSYIVFVEEFAQRNNSYIPYLILFYVYLRGFTSIRSNLSSAFVLFAIVAYSRNKKILAYILAIMAPFFQKAAVIYSAFLIFAFMYKRKQINLIACATWLVTAGVAGKIGQYIIAHVNIPFLNSGAYRWYAVYSQEGLSFFDNFWKIALPQMLLAAALVYYNKEIRKDINNREECERKKLNFVYLICCYDIILIPITYILNIWRGYEFLYIARLTMWSEIVPIIRRRFTAEYRHGISVMIASAFIGWMIFRIANTWEDSGLMPYIFQPLYELTR